MISVCMASFCGSCYVEQQISSILSQIGENDEFIIVDDCSTDDTVRKILGFDDRRIKLFVNTNNVGHVKSFEKALGYASGEFIFLADQDDIWVDGRVKFMLSLMHETNCKLLVTNQVNIKNNDRTNLYLPYMGLTDVFNQGVVANIFRIFAGRAPYFGCAMVIDRELLKKALPFPRCVVAHDIWLAVLANANREISHSNYVSIFRRLHGNNLTPVRRRSFLKVIESRLLLTAQLFVALKRIVFL